MTGRNWAFDAAVAAVVVVLGVLEAGWGVMSTHRQGPVWGQMTLYVVTGALVVLRRRSPLACFVAIIVLSGLEFAAVGSPEGDGVMLPALLVAYAIGRYESRRRAWTGLGLTVVLWFLWVAFDPMDATLDDRGMALLWLAPWVIAWLVGSLVRATALTAEQRRLTRAQRASRAVAEERNRIARELHDVIGHSVSVMTVQASAVRRRLHQDQAVERQALETVEAVGREALAEMRRMVGVLRQGDAADPDREPPPGLGQVDRLVEKFRTAGLPVQLSCVGQPPALVGGLDLTAYRLLQEGLTNTLRHAVRPTRVQVTIEHRTDELRLSVQDDGRELPRSGESGNGLLGMRERVAVYGGTLVARPRHGGGFELLATLPLSGTVPAQPSLEAE